MKDTILIGATGFLGSRIAEKHNSIICPLRFEDSALQWQEFANKNPNAKNIILLGRSCRKTSPRRDRHTMLNEVSGVSKILAAFPDTHIIFASTKVVYGLTDNSVNEISRDEVIGYILKSLSGQFINTTVDLPLTLFNKASLDTLGLEHQIYAHTKLCDESLIRYCAKSFTIFRIWDIV